MIFSLAHREVRGPVQLKNSIPGAGRVFISALEDSSAKLMIASIRFYRSDHHVKGLAIIYTLTLVPLFVPSYTVKYYRIRGTRAQWLIPPPVRPWPCSRVLECCQFLDVIIRTRLSSATHDPVQSQSGQCNASATVKSCQKCRSRFD